MDLPNTETLELKEDGPFLHITLNRPDARNAMSLQMVNELMRVFEAIHDEAAVRAVVLRGKGGHFCAGGDIKDMAGARAQASGGESDAFYTLNRRFGHMITRVNKAPQTVIAVLEGAVLGGGFGLACVSDIALAADDARFGLPETGLGVIPAQIAPFVVERVGLTQARRLALTGARFDGREAARLGVVHQSAPAADLDNALASLLEQVRLCAPHANRITKQLMLRVGHEDMETLLNSAAQDFAAAVTGPEGQEGTLAFVQKRKPNWAE